MLILIISKGKTYFIIIFLLYKVPSLDYISGGATPQISVSNDGNRMYLMPYADVSKGGADNNGDEENGVDASQMPKGVVNSDNCLISDTQPETVNNSDCSVSVSGTQSQSKLVNSNNNISQKLENHLQDEGDKEVD